MWLFAKEGFVSIVEDKEHPGNLLVRGRVKGDVEALFPGAKVEVTPKRDYRFRTSLPRATVSAKVAEMITSIDYDNYKDSTALDRHGPYLRVWSVMNDLQQDRSAPRRRTRAGHRRGRVQGDSWYENYIWGNRP